MGLAPVRRDANPCLRNAYNDPTLAEFVVMMALMRLWRIVGRSRSFGVGCNSEMCFALIVANEYGTLMFYGAGRGGGIIGDYFNDSERDDSSYISLHTGL